MCNTVLTVLAAILCVCVSNTWAVDPVGCIAAPSLNFNNTEFFGTWYEVARQPNNPNAGCIQVDATLESDNTTLNINLWHSTSSVSAYQSQNEASNITLVADSTTGYNVTFMENGQQKAPVLTKLLSQVNTTDGVNWLIGCGYTNASDESTSFGFLLSRKVANITGILYVNDLAAQNFTNFQTNNFSTVLQAGCYRSSAAQSLPMISVFAAVLLALFKGI